MTLMEFRNALCSVKLVINFLVDNVSVLSSLHPNANQIKKNKSMKVWKQSSKQHVHHHQPSCRIWKNAPEEPTLTVKKILSGESPNVRLHTVLRMQPSISSLQMRILLLITLKTIINCNYDDTNLELNSSSWSRLNASRMYSRRSRLWLWGRRRWVHYGDHKNQTTTLKVMVIVN